MAERKTTTKSKGLTKRETLAGLIAAGLVASGRFPLTPMSGPKIADLASRWSRDLARRLDETRAADD